MGDWRDWRDWRVLTLPNKHFEPTPEVIERGSSAIRFLISNP